MPDYKSMYFRLFRSVTKAVAILQETQQKTEEMYMDSPQIIELDTSILKESDLKDE